jgi:hypothetical protein
VIRESRDRRRAVLPVRQASLALFGHAYRLDLLAALAGAGADGVVISELATERAVSASVFYPPLRGLSELGLVARLDPETGSRRVRYVPTNAPAWPPLRSLVKYLGVGSAGETGTSE